MVIVEANKLYVNRAGDVVADLEDLSPSDPMYEKGFRFKDNADRTYREKGQYNIRDIESKYDIVRTLR